MSDESKSNGNGAAQDERAPTAAQAAPHLIISVVDISNGLLRIDGAFPNLDYALNMLEQARRELDAQWRLARAAQHQQQVFEAQHRAAFLHQHQKGR